MVCDGAAVSKRVQGAVTIDWTSPGTIAFLVGFVALPAAVLGWTLRFWWKERVRPRGRADHSADDTPSPNAS